MPGKDNPFNTLEFKDLSLRTLGSCKAFLGNLNPLTIIQIPYGHQLVGFAVKK